MDQRSNGAMEQRSNGLTKQWPSGQGAGFPIQGSWVRNHWLALMETQPFTFPRLIKLVPRTPGKRMVKSKFF